MWSPGEDAGPQTGAAERVGSPVRVSISFVTRVRVRGVRAKLEPRGGSLPTGDLSRGGAGRRHRFPGSIPHPLCCGADREAPGPGLGPEREAGSLGSR